MAQFIKVDFEKMGEIEEAVRIIWIVDKPVITAHVVFPDAMYTPSTIMLGVARCNPKDAWDKRGGMRLALQRFCAENYRLDYRHKWVYPAYRQWAWLMNSPDFKKMPWFKSEPVDNKFAADFFMKEFFGKVTIYSEEVVW